MGLKIDLQMVRGEPELVIDYHLALPSFLSQKEAMLPVLSYLSGDKDALPGPVQAALKEVKEAFDESVGRDIGESTLSIEAEKSRLLKAFNDAPETRHKITEFYDDPLVSSGVSLLFEALKNTYDSVIIRNYLASLRALMTPQEFAQKEPLVLEVLKRTDIHLTPVNAIEFRAHFQKLGETQILIEDNGAGKALVDAFKIQHSSNHRARLAQQGQLTSIPQGADNIYDPSHGRFQELGLRTGGFGKGHKVEETLLKSLGARAQFAQENQLGIQVHFQKFPLSPPLAPVLKKFKGSPLETSFDPKTSVPFLTLEEEQTPTENVPLHIISPFEEEPLIQVVPLQTFEAPPTPNPSAIALPPLHLKEEGKKNLPKGKWRPSMLLDLGQSPTTPEVLQSNTPLMPDDKKSPKKP